MQSVGVASYHNYSKVEYNGMKQMIDYLKTTRPEKIELIQPKDIIGKNKSFILIAVPYAVKNFLAYNECRKHLLGALSPIHASKEFQNMIDNISFQVCSFFKEADLECTPAPPQIPLKIMAQRSGVGYYGKNSMIIVPPYGSNVSLLGFVVDTVLEPDNPRLAECKSCNACIGACPSQALDDYRCSIQNCLNHQVQKNKNISFSMRSLLKNLLCYGSCRVCRDTCPENRNIHSDDVYEIESSLLNPKCTELLDIDDEKWHEFYGSTKMGRLMQDKKFLIRNALIALGNFQDKNSVEYIIDRFFLFDEDLRGYAAWALGNIGGAAAVSFLLQAKEKEESLLVHSEIENALSLLQCSRV